MMLAEKYVVADYNAAKKESFNDGEVEGILKSLKNLMKNLQITVDEAMKLLDIPEKDKDSYKKC